MRDVIWVVGMGRSGTSALTRVLSLCGAALPLHVLPANAHNPAGFWEPHQAMIANESFLARHGSSWYDATLRLQLEELAADEDARFVAEITGFLAEGYPAGDGPIIVKDPRLSAVLPYWIEAAARLGMRVGIVHAFRNPADVASSLDRREQLGAEHAYALWLKYNLIGERDGRAFRRTFVSFERLMSDWEETAGRCIRDLQLDGVLRIDAETRRSVAEFLQPNLYHYASEPETPFSDPTPNGVMRRTYALLRDAERGRYSAPEFDAVRREYVRSPLLV